MSSAGKAADAARTSLQRANTSSQSLASISSSLIPLAGPQDSSSSNLPPHTTSSNPTTSIQSTSQPQIRHNNPAPPPAANPSTTTTVRTPVQISQLPHRQQHTSWQLVAARVHHRDDDVRDYCAPGSNGWAEWQERRVADSQVEIGRIDYSWNGGDVIDFAERRREDGM
ncbi:hypothetical protein BKA58DRAFT_43064 [Alternaria rosae]|uniref:uncharacterized protein n=1 Tax=Alternaria rosae TaxID=1187941 RepID=UPI001E8E67C5|nr:uncharacterized protein BKA58DRAFT_43064 [Alternaria rosae]KAH6860953.1 hypothetical protein BKA58DRAFT_43064 [Alternaria rosae]